MIGPNFAQNEKNQEHDQRDREQSVRQANKGQQTESTSDEGKHPKRIETTMPKLVEPTTSGTNSSAQNELTHRVRLPVAERSDGKRAEPEGEGEEADGDGAGVEEEKDGDEESGRAETEAQEDRTRGNSVSVAPEEGATTLEANRVNNEVEYDDQEQEQEQEKADEANESQQAISRRAHNLVGPFGLTKELRKLRNQRKKLFNSKRLTSRRRRKTKSAGQETNADQAKRKKENNQKLLKSMQTRQGSAMLSSSTPTSLSSNYVNLMAEPTPATPPSSLSISSAIKQHLPSFQISSAVQKLLLSKLVGQQQNNAHKQPNQQVTFNQLGPFAPFSDHYSSSGSSLVGVDALPGDVDDQLTEANNNNNSNNKLNKPELEEELSELLDSLGPHQQQPSSVQANLAGVINSNFRLASAAASPQVASEQQHQQQPGKQLIPVEIIGLDPSVSNSILYGPGNHRDVGPASGGGGGGDGLGATPGEQTELPSSDSSQVFAANGPGQSSAEDDQTSDDLEAGHQGPPNSINEQLTRFQQRHPQPPKPSSVFHIHHFHHSNSKVAENNRPEATPTPQEQPAQSGPGQPAADTPEPDGHQQQQQQQVDSLGQQQQEQQVAASAANENGGEQSKQQVAVNERGELVYVPSEPTGNERQQTNDNSSGNVPGQVAGDHPAPPLTEQPANELTGEPVLATMGAHYPHGRPRLVRPDLNGRHNHNNFNGLPQQPANEYWQTLPNQAATLQRGQQVAANVSLPYRNLRHQQQRQPQPNYHQVGARRQRVFHTNSGQTVSLVDNSNNNNSDLLGEPPGGHFDNSLDPNGTSTRWADEEPTRPGLLMVAYKPAVGQQQAAAEPDAFQVNGSSAGLHSAGHASYQQFSANNGHQQVKQVAAYNEGSESKPLQQIMQTNSRLFLNKQLINGYHLQNRLRPPTANLTDLNVTLNRVRPSNASGGYSNTQHVSQPQLVVFKSPPVPLISMNSSQADQSYWPMSMNNSSSDEEDRRILAKFNALQQLNESRRAKQQPNLLLDNLSLIRHLQQVASDKQHEQQQQQQHQQRFATRLPLLPLNNSTKLTSDQLAGLINDFKQQQRQQSMEANVSSSSEPARFELTLPSDSRLSSKVIRHNNQLQLKQQQQHSKSNSTQIKDLSQKVAVEGPTATSSGNRSHPVDESIEQLADSSSLSNIAFAFIFIVSFLTLLLIAASMIYRRRRGSRRCSRLATGVNGNNSSGSGGANNIKPSQVSLTQRSKHFMRSNFQGPNKQMSTKTMPLDGSSGSELSRGNFAKLKCNKLSNALSLSSSSSSSSSSQLTSDQMEPKWKLCASLTSNKQQQKPTLASFKATPNAPSRHQCQHDKSYQLADHSCNVEAASATGGAPGDIKTLQTKLQKAPHLKSIMSQANKRQHQVSGIGDGGHTDETHSMQCDELNMSAATSVTYLNVEKANRKQAIGSSASPSVMYNYRNNLGLVNNQSSTTPIKQQQPSNSTFTATPAAAANNKQATHLKNQLLPNRFSGNVGQLPGGDESHRPMSTIDSVDEHSTKDLSPGLTITPTIKSLARQISMNGANHKLADNYDYTGVVDRTLTTKKQAKNGNHHSNGFKLNQTNKSPLDRSRPPDLNTTDMDTCKDVN